LQVAGLHGGGSPQMESIAMMGRYPLDQLKDISKYLFGIKSTLKRFERQQDYAVTPRAMLEKFKGALIAKQQREQREKEKTAET
jgi:4-hydroxyphenylacetate 3-monooxygenase/4-hydroxybutyryl-CoA dehydratase/vinylacetyl-CoA-Delta-isomerase